MKIAVIGMIYKSPTYLDFMVRGMMSATSAGHQVTSLIVANDATPEVLLALASGSKQFVIYNDPMHDDYYLNRVYRAWNAGGCHAANLGAEVLVFVNSDMWPAEGWLDNLIAGLDCETIPCSRLVESGKLESGEHAIVHDFGRSPQAFRKWQFTGFANRRMESKVEPGGLFMPCAFFADDFVRSGGYPEGNVYAGGVGAHGTKFLESGDHHFFYKNPVMREKRHITVFDSLVCHFQQGEQDDEQQ